MRRTQLLRVPLLPVAALIASAAHAAHPLITEDTGTQGAGNWQLEVTAEWGHEHDGALKARTRQGDLVLSYGLHERADLIVGIPHLRVEVDDAGVRSEASGVGDVGLDLKWRFYEHGVLSFAVKAGVTFPTGDETKGFGTGQRTHSLYLVTTLAPQPWDFNLHLGHIRNNNVIGEREDIWHASFAGGYRFVTGLRLVLDLGTESNPDPASDVKPEFLIAGLIYPLSDAVDIDLGYKKGLSAVETDHMVLAGLTLRF